MQGFVLFGHGDNITCKDYDFLPWEIGYGFFIGTVVLFEAGWIYYYFCKRT